jgi:hypothetical protein
MKKTLSLLGLLLLTGILIFSFVGCSSCSDEKMRSAATQQAREQLVNVKPRTLIQLMDNRIVLITVNNTTRGSVWYDTVKLHPAGDEKYEDLAPKVREMYPPTHPGYSAMAGAYLTQGMPK